MRPDATILVFLFSLKPALSFSSFTLIKRLFSSSSLSAIRVVTFGHRRLLMFLPPILIPACNSSSLAFLMMCSAYRLIKEGDSKQPCHAPFSFLNHSVVPYRVLTVASWSAYRFLRKQVRWSGIPISLRAFHSLSWQRCWWTYFQGRNKNSDIENRLMDTVGEGEGGPNWESSFEIHILLCVKWTANKMLLCSTGSSAWYSVTTRGVGWGRGRWDGDSRGREHMHTYD